MTDFETDLSVHCMRKKTAADEQQQQQQQRAQDTSKTYDVEPLLIQHLLQADTSSDIFSSCFQGTVQFKRCMIYGRIVAAQFSPIFTNYKVDDGTGAIFVSIFNKEKEKQEINEMKQQLHTVDSLQLRQALERLLNVSEQLIDLFKLELGTRIVVLGRPTILDGELRLKADDVLVDDGTDRSFEIDFKHHLIERYLARTPEEEDIKNNLNEEN